MAKAFSWRCLALILLTCGFLALPLTALSEVTDAQLALQSSQQLNINQATAEQLTALPGIGPARAEAIITLRENKGELQHIDELQEVRGIGPSLTRQLEPLVSF